ncbi:sulfite exporter TauE/SafE family protein [Skermania sp. ID1734]|uniref:sulfite exporter TauE/SafE family protein n=1 Tax=Skermania sp. ID1734 TaxID=2597516 RepID=UPI00117FA1E5|nr:sulfite exporter TauE/SafE family protein [Skermania sp. ID1734]TSD93094.1 sulfite exporter TauE/SafE family protein [Skermania sp. ID1734]
MALLFGAVIGLLLGLLGGGGSILAVPLLVYGLGLTLPQAVPVSLVVVGSAAAVGVLPKLRAHEVQWRLAAVFALSGAPGTVLGALVGEHVSQRLLMGGFAVVMIAAGVRMLSPSGELGTACSIAGKGINWRRCVPRAVPTGFGVGVLTGLFGVGGGFLIVPALVLMLGVAMPTAIGTSLVIIVANSLTGLAAHLSTEIDWPLTAAFACTAVLASLVTSHVGSSRLDTHKLQRWFAYLVFGVAAFIAVDTLLS